jgi:Fe-S oxidoreductase
MPDLETSLTYCTFCPSLCRHTCPVSNAEARETLVPRSKMMTMRRLHRGEAEPSPQSHASAYACTGCGACSKACLHEVQPSTALFAGRAEAVKQGKDHPAARDLPERVRAHAAEAARAMRAAVPVQRFPSEAQVAFLPGCDDPEGAATAVRVLDRLGAGYVAVADVSLACGGYPLHAGGHLDAFRAHAEALARELHGYQRVVVACPACAWAMNTQYPLHGVRLRPEVIHLAAFLAPLVEAHGALRPQPAAFYHDPCYLGRWSGVYEPPRKLLARALAETHEFSRARDEAQCSGGGGLLPLTMPETADAIASARLAEVHEAGLERVVTACPTCKQRLGREGVSAVDLLDVLDAATAPEE